MTLPKYEFEFQFGFNVQAWKLIPLDVFTAFYVVIFVPDSRVVLKDMTLFIFSVL